VHALLVRIVLLAAGVARHHACFDLRAPGMLLDWARVGAEQITGCHGAYVERSGCFCMGVACCTLPWMVQMWKRLHTAVDGPAVETDRPRPALQPCFCLMYD
jgi:hypothetical protein